MNAYPAKRARTRITRSCLVAVMALLGAQAVGVMNAAPASAIVGTPTETSVCLEATSGCSASTTITFGDNANFFGKVVDSDDGCKAFHDPDHCDPPTGTVNLFDGGFPTPIATATLQPTLVAEGNTSVYRTTGRGLTAGSHTITAKYSGDGEFAFSTGSMQLTVLQAATSITFNSGTPDTTVFGESVTFGVTVSPHVGISGNVQFVDGNTGLGPPVPVDANGIATLTTSTLPTGTHVLSAKYLGDTNYKPSQTLGLLVHSVVRASSKSIISSSANPSVWGQQVTFTGTVVAVGPGQGVPTGTITPTDNAVDAFGDITLVNGSAQFAETDFEVGSHVMAFSYSGDPNFKSSTSSNALTQVVNKADTTTAVTSSVNPSTSGQAVTLKATIAPVAPGAGTPTGTVQFKDGATNLGVAVPVTASSASLVISTLGGGPHPITAVYSGDAHFNGSTSDVLTQTVTCDNNYTGTVSGNLTVGSTGTTCLNSAHVTGWLIIPNGASVSLTNSVVNGQVLTTGSPRFIQFCGSELRGATTISNVTGLVLLGDQYDDACAPNQFNSTVSLSNNTHGVELVGNKIYGNTTVSRTSGGPTEIGANTIYGRLTCTNNDPVATNNGHPNTVAAQYGECADPNF